MLACLAALFFLGYVNSCESEPNRQIADTPKQTETVKDQ